MECDSQVRHWRPWSITRVGRPPHAKVRMWEGKPPGPGQGPRVAGVQLQGWLQLRDVALSWLGTKVPKSVQRGGGPGTELPPSPIPSGGPAQCHSLPPPQGQRPQRSVSGSRKCPEDLRTEGSREDGTRDGLAGTGYWWLAGVARAPVSRGPELQARQGPQLGRKARGCPRSRGARWEGAQEGGPAGERQG